MQKLFLIILILLLGSPVHALEINDAKKFLHDGRERIAIEAFNQILEKNKNNAEAYYYRGICHFNLEEFNKGISDFMNAIIQNSIEYENKVVNEIINKTIETIPHDKNRLKTHYLIDKANEFTPEAKRGNVSILFFNKILSISNELMLKRNIEDTEDYLLFAENYFKYDISKKVKIEQKIRELEKLKAESNDKRAEALRKLKKSKTKSTLHKKGSYRPIDIYKMKLGSAIEKNWEYNEALAKIDQSLETRILLTVAKSGVIKNVVYETTSGNKNLDESAKKAIVKSSPLPPLPNGMESYNVVVIFTPRGLK